MIDHFVTKRGQRVRRLSLTILALAAAREVMFIVSGRLKADMLAAVLERSAGVPATEVDAAASQRAMDCRPGGGVGSAGE